MSRTCRPYNALRTVAVAGHTSCVTLVEEPPGSRMGPRDGNFAFEALVPGEYDVFVEQEGRPTGESTRVDIRAGETTTIELDGPPLNDGSERP